MPHSPKVERSPIEIVFEDEFFKIINKPAGWVCEDAEARRTFGPNHFLIHRLDKETSGLLLIAKTKEVKERFISLFSAK